MIPQPISSHEYSPEYCRLEAFNYFFQHYPRIKTTHSLLHCALATSMHAIEDVAPSEVESEIQRLVKLVRQRCRSRSEMTLISYLHEVLFEQEQFQGCGEAEYYHPRNSYFSCLLKTKRGLPIMLSLLYKTVAEKIGLRVEGIRSPGHFLLRVHDGNNWLIVDPYHRGRMVDLRELSRLYSNFFQQPIELSAADVPISTHGEWIERILVNLAYAFTRLDCGFDSKAMNEILFVMQSR